MKRYAVAHIVRLRAIDYSFWIEYQSQSRELQCVFYGHKWFLDNRVFYFRSIFDEYYEAFLNVTNS